MADPYDGDILTYCDPGLVDFSRVQAIVVSGVTTCGHMLINTGGLHGWYFHVARFRSYPRFMGYLGFLRYLKENKKRVLVRRSVSVTDPSAAALKLEELTAAKWTWGILPHNCVSFVEEILQAGGADFGLISNCPVALGFD